MTLHKPSSTITPYCPIRDVLDRLGGRWTILILFALKGGTLRFSALKAQISDISQRMLAQTLRMLEQDGLVSRRIYPTIPPKVEYALTDLGRSLLLPVDGLVEWAETHHGSIRAARQAYEARGADDGEAVG